jgi:hypothetical protein
MSETKTDINKSIGYINLKGLLVPHYALEKFYKHGDSFPLPTKTGKYAAYTIYSYPNFTVIETGFGDQYFLNRFIDEFLCSHSE